ncbi:MAG: hypothetical protein ABL901_13200 [Hyphomicrobiaceae bacterium]
MSGSFVRCLVATAVLVSASGVVQAAPEAPNAAQLPTSPPAITLQAEPAAPTVKLNAPTAPVALERPPLPVSEANGVSAPAVSDQTARAVEAPAAMPAPAKAAEEPVNTAPAATATLERAPLPASQTNSLPASPAAEQPVLPVQRPASVVVSPKTADAPSSPSAPAPAPVQVVIPNNAGISDEERAKQILANEQRGTKPKLHQLQTQSPDYNIVICEAGCGDSRAHIVYKKPLAAVRSVLADPAAANAPLTKKAECRGGCDANPIGKQASLGSGAPALLNDTAGSWMTTVEPTPVATTRAKSQAGKSLKEDWMARINRDRAAANQGPQTTMSPPEAEEKEPLITEPSHHRER